MTRRFGPLGLAMSRGVLGVAALFSGAALLAHILLGVSLVLSLAVTSTVLVAAVAAAWLRSSPATRHRLLPIARTGLLAGVAATATYDAARYLLSQVDGSAFNPFETVRVFGQLLVGTTAPETVTYAMGTAFHALNGVAFGVGFCFLFGAVAARSWRRGVAAGIGWALFLEAFQLTLYPGWLDIRAYREFAQISAASHVAFGAALGLGAHLGMRMPPSEPLSPPVARTT